MKSASLEHVQIEKLTPSNKPGAIQAYVTLVARGIRISDARVVEGSKGTFVAYPQRSWEGREGTKYSNVVEITDADLKDAIEKQVLDAWRRS